LFCLDPAANKFANQEQLDWPISIAFLKPNYFDTKHYSLFCDISPPRMKTFAVQDNRRTMFAIWIPSKRQRKQPRKLLEQKGTNMHLLYRTDRISASRNNDLQFQYHNYPRTQDAENQHPMPALLCPLNH
jgi:hypothetical protein